MSHPAEIIYPVLQRRDPRLSETLLEVDILTQFPSVAWILQNADGDFERAYNSVGNPRELSWADVQVLAANARSQMHHIELAARNPDKWNILQKVANNIAVVVDFSAPGTYYRMEKGDRHQGWLYSWGQDRQRADIAARLGIHLAGIVGSEDLSAFANDDILDGADPQLEKLRSVIKLQLQKSGPRFVYIGNNEEGDAIRRVLSTPSAFIPRESIDIIHGKYVKNTYDQVRLLQWYLNHQMETGILRSGDGIVFVMGFQAVRALRMCESIGAIPNSLHVYLFPTKTHEKGIAQYAERETRGTIAEIIKQRASLWPISYKLIGRI